MTFLLPYTRHSYPWSIFGSSKYTQTFFHHLTKRPPVGRGWPRCHGVKSCWRQHRRQLQLEWRAPEQLSIKKYNVPIIGVRACPEGDRWYHWYLCHGYRCDGSVRIVFLRIISNNKRKKRVNSLGKKTHSNSSGSTHVLLVLRKLCRISVDCCL